MAQRFFCILISLKSIVVTLRMQVPKVLGPIVICLETKHKQVSRIFQFKYTFSITIYLKLEKCAHCSEYVMC